MCLNSKTDSAGIVNCRICSSSIWGHTINWCAWIADQFPICDIRCFRIIFVPFRQSWLFCFNLFILQCYRPFGRRKSNEHNPDFTYSFFVINIKLYVNANDMIHHWKSWIQISLPVYQNISLNQFSFLWYWSTKGLIPVTIHLQSK